MRRISVLLVLVGIGFLGLLAMAGNESRLKWSLQGESVANPIQLDGKTVVFPDKKEANFVLNESERAYPSENGKICLVYDREKQQCRIFDSVGQIKGMFKTDKPVGDFQVSDAELIVAHSETPPMRIGFKEDLWIYNYNGKMIYQIESARVGYTHLKFSPDGKIAILLIAKLVKSDGTSPDIQPMAVFVDKDGAILSYKMTENYTPGNIQFYYQNPKIAFAVWKYDIDKELQLNDVYIYDITKNTWGKIVCDDLDNVLDRNEIALSEDGDTLFVAGLRFLRAYDITNNKKKWQVKVDYSKDIAVTECVNLTVVRGNVIMAHRSPVSKTHEKYLISMFDLEGESTKTFLTPNEYQGFYDVPPIWTVSKDKCSIKLNLKPPTEIELPSKGSNKKEGK